MFARGGRFTALLASAAPAQIAPNPAAPAVGLHAESGVIEGRVFQATTGAALGRARVVVEGTSQEALTDDSGSVRLHNVPVGDAKLSVSSLGLSSRSITVRVPPNGVAQAEIELTRGLASPPAMETEVV
ncbi:MAG: hypothetical protein CK548_02480 [Opitutia bacterium]|nr:hypothetical protein [Opitutaceae bacterium]PHX73046.1 MAG: hypothetical protein CK548_02480 [Opitutae bacterium]